MRGDFVGVQGLDQGALLVTISSLSMTVHIQTTLYEMTSRPLQSSAVTISTDWKEHYLQLFLDLSRGKLADRDIILLENHCGNLIYQEEGNDGKQDSPRP